MPCLLIATTKNKKVCAGPAYFLKEIPRPSPPPSECQPAICKRLRCRLNVDLNHYMSWQSNVGSSCTWKVRTRASKTSDRHDDAGSCGSFCAWERGADDGAIVDKKRHIPWRSITAFNIKRLYPKKGLKSHIVKDGGLERGFCAALERPIYITII